MAKAKAEITLSRIVDIASVTRYYKLQASTAAAPAKPTANPPSGWTTTEPSYTSGSTQTLYCVDLTGFTNGTWSYSEVSKSSSYEAAKAAYTKANAVEGELKLYVKKDDNNQIVSMINASANQITLKSNRLTIDSDNFKLAADGTVTAQNANLKGSIYLDNGLYLQRDKRDEYYDPQNPYIKVLSAGYGTDMTKIYAEYSWDFDSIEVNGDHNFYTDGANGTYADYMSVGSLKINSALVNDFVIAYGTTTPSGADGTWKWWKFASGLAICRYNAKNAGGLTTTWGSWAASADFTFPAYPFVFAETPVVYVSRATSGTGNGYGLVTSLTNGTPAQPPTVTLIRPSKVSISAICMMVAIGMWK